jgi:predicted MPP superfamily phosphohydrolase
MAQFRLRILHISDLHERVALDWMDEERKAAIRGRAASRHRVLGNSFLQVMREIRDERPIDFVCFTGDVADWGLLEEYQAVTLRINAILRSVNVPIERTFIIPGNHDVQRKEAQDAWKQLRHLGQYNTRGLSEWMAGMRTPYEATSSWRDDIQKRTGQFWDWVVRDLGREDRAKAPTNVSATGLQLRDSTFPFRSISWGSTRPGWLVTIMTRGSSTSPRIRSTS